MTRIGYVKPQTFQTPARPSYEHRIPTFIEYTILLQALADCKVQSTLVPVGIPAPPLVLSLSTPSSSDVTGKLPDLPQTAPRFSQPPGSLNVRNDLRVCSTPLALVGLSPQSLTCVRSSIVPNLMLLHRYRPFMVSISGIAATSRSPSPYRSYPNTIMQT